MKTSHTISIVSVFAFLASPIFASAASAVMLGTADNFSILSKTGVSASSSVQIVGSIGVSPATANTITGFELSPDVSNQFSTSPSVNGKIYTSDSAAPTPATLNTAASDMMAAYNDGITRPFPLATNKSSGNIGELAFTPGIYKWNTPVSILSDITLYGGAEDAWIFQVAGGNLEAGPNVKIILADGALAKNIFWAVEGNVALGANSIFNGNILSRGAVTLGSGATLYGKILSQNNVILGAGATIKPNATAIFTPAIPPAAQTETAQPVIVPPQGADPSNEALQAQVNALLATVQALMEQLQKLQGADQVSVPATPSKKFSQDLFFGTKGDDVAALQLFLISRHSGQSTDALASVGATGNFGLLTKQALMEFQKAVDIMPASGYFGPKTRNYINSL
ncbi:MAG: DUF3494 domain-containing protein [Parcubacteria group bacterium]|nr:DUF3494 domain-containing protein [Parcubacteria group bacterium]